MDLCQCKLRASRCALQLTLLLHGAVMLALLLAPWSGADALIFPVLLMLVAVECARSRLRIVRRKGHFILHSGGTVSWQQRQWLILSPPWLSQQAILLSLRDERGQRETLWLFADAMLNREWRLLRQQLLIHQVRVDE